MYVHVYISREGDRPGSRGRRAREPRRRGKSPPFVLLHALPRGGQGRQDGVGRNERRKDARRRRGEIRQRAPDLHLGRHASRNLFGEEKCLASPLPLRRLARRCFAFYTGVEIWSLDAPPSLARSPQRRRRVRTLDTSSASIYIYSPRSTPLLLYSNLNLRTRGRVSRSNVDIPYLPVFIALRSNFQTLVSGILPPAGRE